MATKLHYTLPAGFNHVKRIRSNTGLVNYLYNEVYTDSDGAAQAVGMIVRESAIPSPYAYASEWDVYRTRGTDKYVIVRETAHRCFDVIEVPTELVTLD